ncbi:MAG: InlB B-repeat-containing protein, partial [bacterium]
VYSAYGTPSPLVGRHYFVPNTLVNATCPAAFDSADGVRFICTGWTGTGSVPSSGSTNSVSFRITENSSITWNWRREVRLTISSAFDSPNPPNGAHWYTSGSTITASVNLIDGDMVCIGYYGSGSVSNGLDTSVTFTITTPTTITWLWTELSGTVTLNVSSERGSPVPSRGIHYYPAGTSITAYVPDSIITIGDTRYLVSGYTGTGSVSSGSGARVSFVITTNSTLTWNWKTQYQFTVVSSFGSPVPPVGTHWFDSSSTVTGYNSLTDRGPTGVVVCIGYDGTGSLGDAPDTSFTFIINMPSSVTWQWIPIDSAALLIVNSAYGNSYPSRGSHYFRRNTEINAHLDDTLITAGNTRYRFIGWNGTGSVPPSGTTNSFTFIITTNSTITWNWQTQYRITLDFSGCNGYVPSQRGDGWYSAGSEVPIVSDSVVGVEGDMYAFVNWTSTPSGAMIRDANNHRTTVFVSSPYTLTANYSNAIRVRLVKEPCHTTGYFIIDDDTVTSTSCTLLVYLAFNTIHRIGVSELDTNTVTGYGYRFGWWSDRGERIHSIGPLRNDTLFVATYTPLYRAIIRKEPLQTLGSFTVDRILYTGSSSARLSFWWDAGSIHNIVASTPDVSDTVRYVFVRWSDDGARDHNVTITAPTEYIAYYRTEFLCRIIKQPAQSYGNITINDSTYTRVSSVTFWAVKDLSYRIGVSSPDISVDSIYTFTHWSDGGELIHNTAPIRSPTLFVAYYVGVEGILRACLTRDFWDIGLVELSGTRNMTASEVISVANCGTVPMTVGLYTYDPDNVWSPGYTNGTNTYIIRARFDDNPSPPSSFNYMYDYVKRTVTWATSERFGPKGFNIQPPGSSDTADNMWLQFVAPVESSTYSRKTIYLVIELSVYLP